MPPEQDSNRGVDKTTTVVALMPAKYKPSGVIGEKKWHQNFSQLRAREPTRSFWPLRFFSMHLCHF